MQCALCASPIAGDPDAMALICKNGHQDVVHDKCYKNRYSNEVYKKAQQEDLNFEEHFAGIVARGLVASKVRAGMCAVQSQYSSLNFRGS